MLRGIKILTAILAVAFCSIISFNSFADDKDINNKKSQQQILNSTLKETSLEMKIRKKIEKEMKEKKVETEQKNIVEKRKNDDFWHTVLFYIPNRLIDLTDIISLEGGLGPEASLELTLTKWFQFGGSYGDRYFIESGYNRQYGGGYSSGYNASFACLNNEQQMVDYTFGTVKPYVNLDDSNRITPCPCKKPYVNGIVDFWRIGIKAGWIVDVGISVHPVAIANFFTGFFFVRLTDTQDI
ncbi:MAG TPA: hypothetical protein QF753_00030 [Victivallales bacterium]|nr:hypothetical protein [Victivallales bacterium]